MDGLSDVELHLVDSVDEAQACLRWLGERHESPICVDTETTGLQPHGPNRDRIRLGQLGDEHHGWAFQWGRWSGAFVEALQRYDGQILAHNAKYDWALLEHDAPGLIPWRRMEDTRTLAWLADPTRPTGLKPLAARYVDSRAVEAQRALDVAMQRQDWGWATIPDDFTAYWAYGALDTVLTSRVWLALKDQVFASEGLRRAYELEVAVLPTLVAMERRGARVDSEYARERMGEFDSRFRQLQEWARIQHGVSLTSGAQLVKRFQAMGVELTKQTPGGAWSMDREVKDLLGIHPDPTVSQLARAAKKAQQLDRLQSAYLSKMVDAEYIHASINPIGAPKTSRMSISGEMALQTLPRADSSEEAIEVRNCFIPRDGNLLVMCDFDQIELRLIGHYSQDPQMMAVLRDVHNPLDPFTQFAQQIYGDPTLQKKDPRRQLTKNAAYADGYGAGDEKFAVTAGVPLEQAVAFRRAYHATFPGIKAFQQHVEQVGRQRVAAEDQAYVITPFGHRLVCAKDKLYKMVNYLVQGTAANVMKQKLIDLDAAGLGQYLVMPVHDEVVMDAPADIAAEVGAAAREVMQEDEMFAVPLPVGVDGPYTRWGAKYAA